MPPQHKHHDSPEVIQEYKEGFINLGANIGFIIGGILFLGEATGIWKDIKVGSVQTGPADVGDYFFIIGAFLGFVLAARSLNLSGYLDLHDHVKSNHITLSILYTASTFLFLVGALMFYPHITPESTKTTCEAVGAWMFVIGSLGYVVACFYNAVALGGSMGKISNSLDDTVYQRTKYAILACLLGSVFFVVGSFLYRPAFAKSCNPPTGELAAEAAKPCHETARFGTFCYILGAVLFTLDSMLEINIVWLKANAVESAADEDETKHLLKDA